MNFKTVPVITIASAFVLLFALNLIGNVAFKGASVDLTKDGIYTLSDGSRSILGKVVNNIKIKLFYSKEEAQDVPSVRQYAERVIELLRRYEEKSGGKITLEILDPRPDTEVEEQAIAAGIRAMQIKEDSAFYFGLSLVSDVGREESLAFLDPSREESLEYDITRLISLLGGAPRKTIGIVTSLEIAGNEDNPMVQMGQMQKTPPWALYEDLKYQFEVKMISANNPKIDDDVSLLIVLHPKNATSALSYAIDQFLMNGGRALIAVDPLNNADKVTNPEMAQVRVPSSSDLPELFKAWGISLVPGRVTVDPQLATTLFDGQKTVRFPTFLSLKASEANPEEKMTEKVNSLIFVHSGALEPTGEPPAGLTRTTLLSTTESGGDADAYMLQFVQDTAVIMRDFKPANKKVDLAVLLSGKFPSAYKSGPPEGALTTRPHLAEAKTGSAVVVFADADWFWDPYCIERRRLLGQTVTMALNDNLTLFANTAEILSGDPELVNLRARTRTDRPFTYVESMARDAQTQWQDVEKELMKRQEETNRKLNELQNQKDGGDAASLSPSQAEEIKKFRTELAQTKMSLREVRRNLRQNVENLGSTIKFVNIIVVPLLVLVAGFTYLWLRNSRISRRDGGGGPNEG